MRSAISFSRFAFRILGRSRVSRRKRSCSACLISRSFCLMRSFSSRTRSLAFCFCGAPNESLPACGSVCCYLHCERRGTRDLFELGFLLLEMVHHALFAPKRGRLRWRARGPAVTHVFSTRAARFRCVFVSLPACISAYLVSVCANIMYIMRCVSVHSCISSLVPRTH